MSVWKWKQILIVYPVTSYASYNPGSYVVRETKVVLLNLDRPNQTSSLGCLSSDCYTFSCLTVKFKSQININIRQPRKIFLNCQCTYAIQIKPLIFLLNYKNNSPWLMDCGYVSHQIQDGSLPCIASVTFCSPFPIHYFHQTVLWPGQTMQT